jgi:hypothetical protein
LLTSEKIAQLLQKLGLLWQKTGFRQEKLKLKN